MRLPGRLCQAVKIACDKPEDKTKGDVVLRGPNRFNRMVGFVLPMFLGINLSYAIDFEPPTAGEVIGGQIADAYRSIIDAQVSNAEFTKNIRTARRAYFECRPDCDQKDQVTEQFAAWLFRKDWYYLTLGLAQNQFGGSDPVAAIERLAGDVDGGVTKDCLFHFAGWVSTVKSNMGDGPVVFNIDNLDGALTASQPSYDLYRTCRDKSEWSRRPLLTIDFTDSETYLHNAIRLSDPRGDRSNWRKTLDDMTFYLGEDLVANAAEQVFQAPKKGMRHPFVLSDPGVLSCSNEKAYDCIREIARRNFDVPQSPQIKKSEQLPNGTVVHNFGYTTPDFVPDFPSTELDNADAVYTWRSFSYAPANPEQLRSFGVESYDKLKRRFTQDPEKYKEPHKTRLIEDDASLIGAQARLLMCDYHSIGQTYFWYKTTPDAGRAEYLRTRLPVHPLVEFVAPARDECPATGSEAAQIFAGIPVLDITGTYKLSWGVGVNQREGRVTIEAHDAFGNFQITWVKDGKTLSGFGYVDGRIKKDARLITSREEGGLTISESYVLYEDGSLHSGKERLHPLSEKTGGPVPSNAPAQPSQTNAAPDTVRFASLSQDNQPEILVQAAPKISMRASARGGQGPTKGSVTVEFTIDPTGAVKDAVVVEATPPNLFDRSALRAMTQSRYKPVIVNGKAVTVTNVRRTFNFE